MKSVSIKDIAQEAGCSAATVSMALRGSRRISLATRQRIEELAEQLGYRPNRIAQALVGSATCCIGIVSRGLRDLFYVDLFTLQEKQLGTLGYSTHLMLTHRDPAVELQAVERLLAHGVDGFFFYEPPRNPAVLERLGELIAQGMPVVQFGSGGIERADKVTYDDPAATCALTRHLLELGHRRIALVTHEPEGWRAAGYRQALESFGVPFDPRLVFPFEFTYEGGVQAVRQQIMALKQRPTAIFAHNDDMAIELVVDLTREGYQVPAEVSVAGVNDGWYADWGRVPLTTIRLSQKQMAQAMVDLLMQRLAHPELEPRQLAFGGELVVRASTAPPASQWP